jgi:hypothetical protein
MERMMRANGIIKLSCLLFAASAVAAEIGYTNKAAGISIRLPEGWIIAEGKAAEEMAGLQARLEPVIRSRETLASFVKADSGMISSAFPKVIVQWQRDAEVGIKQFQNIHAFNGAVERMVGRGLGFKDERGVCRYADYDPNRNALSFTFPCQNGDVIGVGYSFATSNGLVNVYCYSLTDDWERWRNEFTLIAQKIEIASENRVKAESRPRLIENSREWKFVGFVALMFLLSIMKALGKVPFLREPRSDEV